MNEKLFNIFTVITYVMSAGFLITLPLLVSEKQAYEKLNALYLRSEMVAEKALANFDTLQARCNSANKFNKNISTQATSPNTQYFQEQVQIRLKQIQRQLEQHNKPLVSKEVLNEVNAKHKLVSKNDQQ